MADAGGDIKCCNNQGVDIMHMAVEKGYYDIVKMLIQSKFPINCITKSGLSPLYIAIQ